MCVSLYSYNAEHFTYSVDEKDIEWLYEINLQKALHSEEQMGYILLGLDGVNVFLHELHFLLNLKVVLNQADGRFI